MKKPFFVLLAVAFMTQTMLAQKELPIIKATSTQVVIREDSPLRKSAWTIVPEANPDVYTTSAKKVTFYTDIDSISFTINPNEQYDFVILLNEKDSANTRIVWEESNVDIYKTGATYNYSDTRSIPKFTYQSQDDPNLLRIRKDLHLDSIAGSGNELSQIFNLMHCVHNLIKHDGNSNNPTLKNAIDLIKICKAENRGVNCRMMATVLNECYLSMGIKSRYITCMPRERNLMIVMSSIWFSATI